MRFGGLVVGCWLVFRTPTCVDAMRRNSTENCPGRSRSASVDCSDGNCFRSIENGASFGGQESDAIIFLFEQLLLGTLFAEKLDAILIRFKSEFFGQKSNLDVQFVSVRRLSAININTNSTMELTLCRW